MSEQWHSHDINFAETFELRKQVLEAASSLVDRWRVSTNGKALEFDLPLSSYSHHERSVIEFAINPYETSKNIFHGLDKKTAAAMATSIHQLFGPNGPLSK